ncbi:hypothetical protein [Euzebya rosea]|uniref:hypothetical protein n=1 Tax=Euzebya rosea TaxID=2052804 RepID=UPI000D3EBEC9|nr:hypothetical protein [Euzebya rosea]
MNRGTIIRSWTEGLVAEVCCNCGMAFAMPISFKDQRLADGKTFSCPAGHEQHYTARKDEVDSLKRQLAAERGNRRHTEELLDREKRSKAAYKGQLTRTRKRVAAGVCPCCNRSFENLARHMSGQHPEWSGNDPA